MKKGIGMNNDRISEVRKALGLDDDLNMLYVMSEMGDNDEMEDEFIDEPLDYIERPKKEFKLTPKKLKAQLDEVVIKQDEAKKVVATNIFKQHMRIYNPNLEVRKSNILLTGASGSGKTFVVENACKLAGIPYLIYDASKLTKSGYQGASVSDIFNELFVKCDGNYDLIENAVIVLDEIDKVKANAGEKDKADVGGQAVQNELLKVLEGSEVKIGYKNVSTKNMLFILAGSFASTVPEVVEERLRKSEKKQEKAMGFNRVVESKKEAKVYTEKELRSNITRQDIIEAGFIPEIIGRVDIIVNLLPLELDDFKAIVRTKSSVLTSCNDLFKLLDKELIVEEDLYDYIAETAFNNIVIGARSINTLISNILDELIYNFEDIDGEKIVLNRSMAERILKEDTRGVI